MLYYQKNSSEILPARLTWNAEKMPVPFSGAEKVNALKNSGEKLNQSNLEESQAKTAFLHNLANSEQTSNKLDFQSKTTQRSVEALNKSGEQISVKDANALATNAIGREHLRKTYLNGAEQALAEKEKNPNAKTTIDVNFGGNGRVENNIGAGDLLEANVRTITVTSAKEQKNIVGQRAPSVEYPNPPRPGYYEKPGDPTSYIKIFTGDKITPDKVASAAEMQKINETLAQQFGMAGKKPETLESLETQLFQNRAEEDEKDEIRREELLQAIANGEPIDPEKVPKGPEGFIAVLTPIAKKAGEQYGLPWQAIVLQAGLESGWNLQAKTIFGIKATGEQSGIGASTHEFANGQMVSTTANFADFGGESLQERIVNSTIGYCRFILDNPRYSGAVQNYRAGGTAGEFLQKVAAAGYATDPNYFRSLTSIANANDIDLTATQKTA